MWRVVARAQRPAAPRAAARIGGVVLGPGLLQPSSAALCNPPQSLTAFHKPLSLSGVSDAAQAHYERIILALEYKCNAQAPMIAALRRRLEEQRLDADMMLQNLTETLVAKRAAVCRYSPQRVPSLGIPT